MSWFLNLRTRAKLFWSFGLLVVLLLLIMGTAYSTITTIQESQQRLYHQDFAIATDLLIIRKNLNAERAGMLTMLVSTDHASQQAGEDYIKQEEQGLDAAQQEALTLGGTDPRLGPGLQQVRDLYSAFLQTLQTQVVPLIYQGKTAEARALILGVENDRYLKLRATATDLGTETQNRAQAAVTQSAQTANQALAIFLAIGGVAVFASVGLGLFLNRIIAAPLTTISGLAARIAQGELAVDLTPTRRADEVGELTRTFARMVARQQEMAAAIAQIAGGDLRVQVVPQSERDVLGGALATMVTNLRKILHDIAEAASVLAAAASEIMAAATQVAAGATETATAVSQTTTTVEEVKQTAQLASEKARYVADSAQRSAQVSQAGTRAVDEAIGGMERIRSQMAQIAESIVRLSEQGQAIGEIITSVSDLAEQSNLLAVNAAIEAAKAGDQGRGFAVVATEVKSLAVQSKAATAQVRGILNDIQKATGSAVMATEQGSKAVEAGATQSGEAGESIRELAASIGEATAAATQIAASSQQQVVGMDQVAQAMESIKQASVQNVASTRQVETSAQGLHELGQKLRLVVAQYQI
ncbi:MAG TPA: methyl-accepting chemotaxis protein [Chloroflexia bacterium]|nr:methyl-accepting chemotaxis protein [Chloroflexia bacterium]